MDQVTLSSTVEARLASSAERALIFRTGTVLAEIERVVILETLRARGFNRTHAARSLGIGIRTLQRKLKQYGVSHIGVQAQSA